MNSQKVRRTVAAIKAVALTGFDGVIIDVETDMKAGLPSLQIVGMGNKAIDEARQRVRSAITNSFLEFPARKLTVNLAPAELPKDGTHLDLPIALSLLVASGQLKPSEVLGAVFAGELALDGHLRPIRGAVVIAEAAARFGATTLFLPAKNVAQARLVSSVKVIGVESLQGLFQHLRGVERLPGVTEVLTPIPEVLTFQPSEAPTPTIDDIIGQEHAKRALAIAAAGRHNLLFSGPPGTGKTLLARTLAELLPPLVEQEIIEVTKLHSLAQSSNGEVITRAPFRAPHHSVTLPALIGGGLRSQPGDISLAHKGVLFLDELPEYPRVTLEALRQPLEDRTVSLSRLYHHITYPADVILAATMNPCPCGFLGDTHTACTCSAVQIDAYRKRVSGPLLDRIDLRVSVSKVNHEQFLNTKSLNKNQHLTVVKLVKNARTMQHKRFNRRDYYNGHASLAEAKKLFALQPMAQQLLRTAAQKMNLSSRASLRVLRVARTIADLASSEKLEEQHIAEALQFR
ncbi:MAG TPA: YifB family Mg chelatase-like AAA ATPase [Dongiaceae bacterium]|nr:YifB family Mg chelatase-like AAA ATPase [Dongiaceae bacterium]